MTTHRRLSLPGASFALAGTLFVLPAFAQTQAPAPNCDGVQQDKAACIREAGAAKQEAARGGLTTSGPSGNQANAMARCQGLPAADKADCEARVGGSANSSTSGSVMGGGVIKETVTPVPAAPAK